jgi:uncharacterized protein (AIM24 family)
MKDDDPGSPMMGTKRRAQYGLSSNDDLYDAATNVRVASTMQHAQGFKPWSTYTGGSYKQFLSEASGYAQSAGTGDPMVHSRGPSGTSIVNGGHSITIAPNITVQGSGSTQVDAQRLASEVSRIIERDVQRMLLRAS